MEITTSWEEEGIAKGLAKGIAIGEKRGEKRGEQRGEQRGLQQGLERERSLVLRQLARRLGALSQRAQVSVARLSFDQLEQLGEALLDFNDPHDLTAWLRAQTTTKTTGRRTKT